MQPITVQTFHKSPTNDKEPRQVTLWVNPDNSVTLLGSVYHGTEIIVDQKLVDDLQKLINMRKLFPNG
jgi:hypothetical protein